MLWAKELVTVTSRPGELGLSLSSAARGPCAFYYHICPLVSVSVKGEMTHHIAWYMVANSDLFIYVDTLTVIEPNTKLLSVS